jgi:hypothetical protein
MKIGEYFNWKAYQPLAEYYPDSFYNSLDDSPDLYSEAQIKTIELRPTLRAYLSQDAESGRPRGYSIRDLLGSIPPEHTRYLSVIDIKHPTYFRDASDSIGGNPVVVGRLDYQMPLSGIRSTDPEEGSSSETLFNAITRTEVHKERLALGFYGALLDDSLTGSEDFAMLPQDLRYRFARMKAGWRNRLDRDDVSRARVDLQRNVMIALCDSVSLDCLIRDSLQI